MIDQFERRKRKKEKFEKRAWMTSHEAAPLLYCTPATVISYANKGHLKCLRTPGGHRRFLKKDVYALKEKMEAGLYEEV